MRKRQTKTVEELKAAIDAMSPYRRALVRQIWQRSLESGIAEARERDTSRKRLGRCVVIQPPHFKRPFAEQRQFWDGLAQVMQRDGGNKGSNPVHDDAQVIVCTRCM